MSTLVHAVGSPGELSRARPVIAALGEMDAFRQLVVQLGDHPSPARDLERPAADGAPVVLRHLATSSLEAALPAFDAVLTERQPVAVALYGDADGIVAAAVAAARAGIPCARLNGGIRAFRRGAPGEVARMVIDTVSDLLFAAGPEAAGNLLAEGVPAACIHQLGDPMLDFLRQELPAARAREGWARAGLRERSYVLVAVRRAALSAALEAAIVRLAARWPVVLAELPAGASAVGCAARERLTGAGVRWLSPDAATRLSLQLGAAAVVTDCGGIEDETSALGTPVCRLPEGEVSELLRDMEAAPPPTDVAALPLGDGLAGTRVAEVLVATYALARLRLASD